MSHQFVREVPRFLLGRPADDLQAHAKADVLLATVPRGHALNLCHVGADALVGVAPEEMDIGMLGRDLPGLPGAATEIEFRERRLQRVRPDLRAFELIELAIESERAARRPQRLQDRDFLVHDLVALLLAPAHALRHVLGL